MNAFLAQILAAFLANLTLTGYGMFAYWSSPALPKLLASDSDLPLTSDQSSWVVSLASLGAIFGPVLALLLADRIGRKWSLYMTALPMLVSWLLIGLAKNYQMLYVARFIGGLGAGAIYAIMPMYLVEIADDRIRGGLGTLIMTMSYVGALATNSTGPWVSRQILALLSSIPNIIFLISFVWMPETPYYYVMKGKREAAYSSLKWLRQKDQLEEELTAIENNVHQHHQNKASIFKLVTNAGNRKSLFIIIGLFSLQQLTGVNAIVSYCSFIFAETGSSISTEVSVIIVNIVGMVSGIFAGLTVDIAGRRPILILSTIGIFISLMAIAVFYHLQYLGRDVTGITWLPLVGVIAFFVTFSLGQGNQPYIITGELFPTDVKALASTVAAMYGSAGGLVVGKLYQVIADAFGTYVVFYSFAACTGIGIIFLYLCVPETKGRSLQDIQNDMNRSTGSTDNILKEFNQ